MTQTLRTLLHAQAKNIYTVNGSHSTFILWVIQNVIHRHNSIKARACALNDQQPPTFSP